MQSINEQTRLTSITRPKPGALLQVLVGLLLCGGSWAIAWNGRGPIRFHSFFLLWFGYILLIDGVLLIRTGSSILARLGRFAWLLFAISIPFWWLFELANIRLGNWHYRLPHSYSWLRYHAEASLAFSTVVPAVFCTAELFRHVIPGSLRWRTIDPSPAVSRAIGIAGAGMMLAALIAPNQLFPLIWVGGFFLTDWIASEMGARSISSQISRGEWGTVVVLFAATLWCGFLWEMWNSRSLPKWTYDIPWANWFHIFEMPLLGYGGYLPFGLELYATVQLVDHLTSRRIALAVRFDRGSNDDGTSTS